MCYVGYIVGETHPCLKTISEKEISSYLGLKPILIIGFEKAVELYPHITIASKAIDEKNKLYYAFSKSESETKYLENLNNFINNCFSLISSNYKIVNIIKLEDINTHFNKVFLHETPNTITITTHNTIFYINKEIISFFGKRISIETVIDCLVGSEIISWEHFKFFGAYLKANNSYKSKEQIQQDFKDYDIDLFMGAICLGVLKELRVDSSLVEVWQRAFSIESFLSKIEVKVDKERIKVLAADDDNLIMQNIYKAIEGDYIIQKYNGTNKITGRIYPFGTGYSLQTLPKSSRDIIIAEPNCVLVEFDYKAFEYSILSQICKFSTKGDPHLLMSQLLFNDNEHRQIGKNLNYSLLYGKSIKTIISETLNLEGLKVSKEELEEKLTVILEPVEQLQKRLEQEFKDKGYLTNYFGRNIYPEKSYAYLNNYIQSTAAEILIIKLEKLRNLFNSYPIINKIVLQSHDSILMNLSLETINETNIAEGIKNLLEEGENSLVNKVDMKYGTTWENIE